MPWTCRHIAVADAPSSVLERYFNTSQQRDVSTCHSLQSTRSLPQSLQHLSSPLLPHLCSPHLRGISVSRLFHRAPNRTTRAPIRAMGQTTFTAVVRGRSFAAAMDALVRLPQLNARKQLSIRTNPIRAVGNHRPLARTGPTCQVIA